jgi:hypothetical protein
MQCQLIDVAPETKGEWGDGNNMKKKMIIIIIE